MLTTDLTLAFNFSFKLVLLSYFALASKRGYHWIQRKVRISIANWAPWQVGQPYTSLAKASC